MKICPYCLGGHEERGTYCCPEHAKRASNQRARLKGSGDRALARVAKAKVAAEQHAQLWRDIAAGRRPVEDAFVGKKRRRDG